MSGSSLEIRAQPSSPARPLELAVEVREGRVELVFGAQTLAPGVALLGLRLVVEGVAPPIDLARGWRALLGHATRLRGLVFALDPRALAERLDAVVPRADLTVRVKDGALEVELALDDATRESWRLVPRADVDGALVLEPDAVVRVGPSSAPATAAAELLVSGARRWPLLRALAVTPSGGVRVPATDGILALAMLPAGLKLPHEPWPAHAQAHLADDGRVVVVVGDDPVDAPVPSESADARRRALAVAARLPAHALDFEAARARLDATLGPPELLAHAVHRALADPARHADAADLAWDLTRRRPDSALGASIEGALAEREGRRADAARAYGRAAEAWSHLAEPAWAGLAALAAARVAPEGRRTWLERAAALRPDDPSPLVALTRLALDADEPGSLELARRWARLARRAADRVAAHLAAAEAAERVLGDAVGAKRHLERALAVDPSQPAALERLGRVLVRAGDPRRAAVILEPLVARAIADQQPAKAAGLLAELADVWAPLDPRAALARLVRARELPATDTPLATRFAAIAEQAQDPEVVREAAERALADPRGLDAERTLRLHLRLARAARGRPGGEARAAEAYEAALVLEPRCLDALEGLGELGRGAPTRWLELASMAFQRGERGRGLALLARVADVPEARERAAELLRALVAQRPDDLEVELAWLELEPSAALRAAALGRLIDHPRLSARRAQLAAQLARAHVELGRLDRAAEGLLPIVDGPAPPLELVRLALGLFARRGDVRALLELARRALGAARGEVRAALLADVVELAAGRGDDARLVAVVAPSLDAAWTAGERPADAVLDRVVALATASGSLDLARRVLERWTFAIGGDATPQLRAELERRAAMLHARAGDAERERASLERAAALLEAPDDALLARLAELHAAADHPREVARLHARRAAMASTPEARLALTLAAAEAFAAQGDDDAASDAYAAVLGAVGPGAALDPDGARALSGLLALARRRGDVDAILGALERAHAATPSEDARVAIRVEQIDALVSAGAWERARALAERASEDHPTSMTLALRAAREAERVGDVGAQARARAGLAAVAERVGADPVPHHAAAAEAARWAGDSARAALHDAEVLRRARLPDHRAALLGALERVDGAPTSDARVERLALARRIELFPARATELLSAYADRLEAEGRVDELVATLRRAWSEARSGTAERAAMFERLEGVLLRAHRVEALVAAWADRAADEPSAWIRAAELADATLGAPERALALVERGIQADPSSLAARTMRLAMLERLGRVGARLDAEVDDARAELDLNVRSERLAELASRVESQGDSERALALTAEACALDPRSATLQVALARRAERAGRPDQAFVALGRASELAVEQATDPTLRFDVMRARVELLRGPLEDPLAAQAELRELLTWVEALEPAGRERLEGLRAARGDEGDAVSVLVRLGAELSERSGDWATHVGYLRRWLEREASAVERAMLHFRLGEVIEWKLGDGDGAEREYRAALAHAPDHGAARRALRSQYLAADRFGDLAEALGVDALAELVDGATDDPPQRRVAMLEALWPRLPRGSEARASACLELADLYRTARDEAEGAVMLLETIIREGPPARELDALERLRVLFLEEERWDLYVEILRRQAERAPDDATRARALADVGDALEWKLGDGPAAEREYRSALAVDPRCELARNRLAAALAAQDRFDELADELGTETLRAELDALLGRGRRESPRVFKASAALARRVDGPARFALWRRVAELLPEPEDQRLALERLRREGGLPEAEAASERVDDALPDATIITRALSDEGEAPAPTLDRAVSTSALDAPLGPSLSPASARAPDDAAAATASRPDDAEPFAWPEPGAEVIRLPLPRVSLVSRPPEEPASPRRSEPPRLVRLTSPPPDETELPTPLDDPERTELGRLAPPPVVAAPDVGADDATRAPALVDASEHAPLPIPEPGESLLPPRPPPLAWHAGPVVEAALDVPIAVRERHDPSESAPWAALELLASNGSERADKALELLVRRAEETPLHRPVLEALLAARRARGELAAAAELAEVLRFGWPDAPLDAPTMVAWRAAPDRVERVRAALAPLVADPLGAFVQRARHVVAAVLPPRPGVSAGWRRPLEPTLALAIDADALADALREDFLVELDAGADGVATEPGEPPAVVVGEDLVALGHPLEAAFLLARAVFELRAGLALEPHVDAPLEPDGWLVRLVEAAELDAGPVRPDALRDAIRSGLGPAGLADLDGLVEAARPRLADWPAYRRRVHQAADLFAVRWVGALEPARPWLGRDRRAPTAALDLSSPSLHALLVAMIRGPS